MSDAFVLWFLGREPCGGSGRLLLIRMGFSMSQELAVASMALVRSMLDLYLPTVTKTGLGGMRPRN